MALIDLEELKSVLGIGDIYPDAEVQEVADAADNVLTSYLTKNDWAVIAHSRTNLVNTIYTSTVHDCYVGQSVTVVNCGSNFNGTKTLTAVTAYSMSYTGTGADYPKHRIVPSGTVSATQYVDYSTVPEIREAALAIAVDIWATRMGTMGQQGVDFQPAPYRLSRGMLTRISGLLAKHIDVGGLVG
jgi:hypothetical protein